MLPSDDAIIEAVAKFGSQRRAAKELNVSRYRVREVLAKGPVAGDDHDEPESLALRRKHTQVLALQRELRELQDHRIVSDAYERMMGRLAELGPKDGWRIPSSHRAAGEEWLPKRTLVACLSDIHYGEVVKKSETGVCDYDPEIAQWRISNYFSNLFKAKQALEVDDVVLLFLGDFMGGEIHDELKDTNKGSAFHLVRELASCLASELADFALETSHLSVHCVAGNHGRDSKRLRFKEFAQRNWDTLCYQLTADYTSREHGIVFDIADGYTHSVPVNGRNYVLTHGHTFRGGDGVLGYVAPITKGAKKVQAQERSKGRSADLVVCGHWHNLHITDFVVCNGALRGYSEYDAGNLFEVGDSRQATWIEEEGVGMTFRYPVEVER